MKIVYWLLGIWLLLIVAVVVIFILYIVLHSLIDRLAERKFRKEIDETIKNLEERP